MTKLKLNVNRDLFKSWVTVTVIWLLVLGGMMLINWSGDVDFCRKFIPEQFPECKDVTILREKGADLYKIGIAVTLLPPIITLLPIIFWKARRESPGMAGKV